MNDANIEQKLREVRKEEKDKSNILILMLGILTLLFALIGASFAYFTSQVKGTEAAESFTMGATTIEGVTYQAKDRIALVNAFPGDSAETQFTITNPNSSATVSYTLKFVTDVNDFSKEEGMGQLLVSFFDGELKETKVLDLTDGANAKEDLIISNVQLKPKESDVYGLKLEFADLGIPQDTNMGKNFSGHIEIQQTLVVE